MNIDEQILKEIRDLRLPKTYKILIILNFVLAAVLLADTIKTFFL
jgi:hypothetical protein